MAVSTGEPVGLHPLCLTDDEVHHFQEFGYLRLGQVVPPDVIAELRARIDAIMLGEVGRDSLNL